MKPISHKFTNNVRIIFITLLLSSFFFLFQNCSEGFKIQPLESVEKNSQNNQKKNYAYPISKVISSELVVDDQGIANIEVSISLDNLPVLISKDEFFLISNLFEPGKTQISKSFFSNTTIVKFTSQTTCHKVINSASQEAKAYFNNTKNKDFLGSVDVDPVTCINFCVKTGKDENCNPIVKPPEAISTNIYITGTNNKICRKKINHFDSSITDLTDINLTFKGAWLSPHPDNPNEFFVAESSSNTKVSKVLIDDDQNINIQPGASGDLRTVHFENVNVNNKMYSFIVDYSGDKLVVLNYTDDIQLQEIFYESDSHPHSVAYDINNNLLFVALLGQDTIKAYEFKNESLNFLYDVTVDDPRMLVFSKKFNALYLMTEAHQGDSSIVVLKTTKIDSTYETNIVSSIIAPGIHGADMKIDEINNYAIGSVREDGNDGVVFVPLNTDGEINETDTRKTLFLNTLANPRAISLSSDSTYLSVAYEGNHSAITVYKLNFNADLGLNTVVKIDDLNCSFNNMLSIHSYTNYLK